MAPSAFGRKQRWKRAATATLIVLFIMSSLSIALQTNTLLISITPICILITGRRILKYYVPVIKADHIIKLEDLH